MAWEALYPGKCATCGDRINVGDTITRNADGYVIHADCAFEARPLPDRPVIVCGVCFLQKPCPCEDGL